MFVMRVFRFFRKHLCDLHLDSVLKVKRVYEGSLAIRAGQIGYVYATPETTTTPTIETANGTKLQVRLARRRNWEVRSIRFVPNNL